MNLPLNPPRVITTTNILYSVQAAFYKPYVYLNVRSSSFSLNNSSDSELTPFSVATPSLVSLGNSCPFTLSPLGPQSRLYATDLPSPERLSPVNNSQCPSPAGGEPSGAPSDSITFKPSSIRPAEDTLGIWSPSPGNSGLES